MQMGGRSSRSVLNAPVGIRAGVIGSRAAGLVSAGAVAASPPLLVM